MTTVVISQPMLFPWPGFFELAANADILVHLDDARFSRGSFTNRVQIKLPTGTVWMTIPLTGSGTFQRICDLEPAGMAWRGSHRNLLRQSLRGADYSDRALELFDACYKEHNLSDLLIQSVEQTVRALVMDRPRRYLRSSSLGVRGTSWRRVLDMVKALGGTRYVTAHGAANYLEHGAFEAEGVEVFYADYSLARYPQRHGEFTPYVSILDLIGTVGPKAADCLSPRMVPWRDFLDHKRNPVDHG